MACDVPSETFSERIYNILNDNTTQPTCQVCGSPVNFMSNLDVGGLGLWAKSVLFRKSKGESIRFSSI